jgi:hypothetical protein
MSRESIGRSTIHVSAEIWNKERVLDVDQGVESGNFRVCFESAVALQGVGVNEPTVSSTSTTSESY